MSPDDFALIQPHLRPTDIALKQVLIAPNEPVGMLYFPESGITSITTDHESGRIEIGLIGREGVVGAAPVLLGSDRTPYRHFIQTAGEVLSIEAGALSAAVARSRSLQDLLLRFVQVQLIQTAQTAFANATFTTDVRLARWLLMYHDRVDGDELTVTHEFLAVMLGVQRTGVTVALQSLELKGLIRGRRARVELLDRAQLEVMAGDSYGTAEAEYIRLIGRP